MYLTLNQKLPTLSRRRLFIIVWSCVWLVACGGGSGAESTSAPPPPAPPPPPVSDPTLPISGFTVVDSNNWTPSAVSKVLHVFALGGHASDQQIKTWSELHPVLAVQEMLTFDAHNLKLSPATPGQSDQLDTRDIALESLAQFWASDEPGNSVPLERRPWFDYTSTTGWLEHLWPTVMTTRGTNPFLNRVAYFEVNQHAVVNKANVPTSSILHYYDDIVRALTSNQSYDQVLAVAASSSAIAQQYGHRVNRYIDNQCFCNEDFAREIYQLFFGITGDYDPNYHETITIKNTAKALSDMRIQLDDENDFTPEVVYGSDQHPVGPLEILNTTIGGTNAQERIVELSTKAIEHPESLNALPVMLIAGLADNNLNPTGEAIVREAWGSMTDKNLLLFLQAYAISTLFHSEDHVKYWNSVERRLLITNKVSSTNDEIYQRIYSVVGHQNEGVRTFRPVNNVFGGQTGDMAASSPDVFRQNYNLSTDDSYLLRRYEFERADFSWQKDWRDVIPANDDGQYTVEHVAHYLWQRLLADNGKYFGPLERAHIFAFLGSDSGLAAVLDPQDLERIYSVADVTAANAAATLAQLGDELIPLNSSDPTEVELASYRIGQAINFIAATPFAFFLDGK